MKRQVEEWSCEKIFPFDVVYFSSKRKHLTEMSFAFIQLSEFYMSNIKYDAVIVGLVPSIRL